MFLIHALKHAIESVVHAAHVVIAALVLCAAIAFRTDMLGEEDAHEE